MPQYKDRLQTIYSYASLSLGMFYVTGARKRRTIKINCRMFGCVLTRFTSYVASADMNRYAEAKSEIVKSTQQQQQQQLLMSNECIKVTHSSATSLPLSPGAKDSSKTHNAVFRGFAKNFLSKNPRLIWKWVGGFKSHSEFFCWENHLKIALNQYWYVGVVYHVYSVCIHTYIFIINPEGSMVQ